MITKEEYEDFRKIFNKWAKEENDKVDEAAERMGIQSPVIKERIMPIPSYDDVLRTSEYNANKNLNSFYETTKRDVQSFSDILIQNFNLSKEQMVTHEQRWYDRRQGILMYFEELGDAELIKWGYTASNYELEALVTKGVISSYIPYKTKYKPELYSTEEGENEAEKIKQYINK